MTELIKNYIGKECIIYTMDSSYSQVQGFIKEVSGSWITVERQSGNAQNVQIINLEYVSRIQEYPRKKSKKDVNA